MPIVGNRHYNSPEIGAAFQGLASLFAPPSAQDTAAYAAAKAKSEEAAREAEAYARMTAEGVSPEVADRYGVAIGRYNPTQSYRALAVGDATTRRGQDVESGDRRYGADQVRLSSMYGADRTYAASTENNVRDNARAVETNAADNVRAIQANEADNARALTDRQMQEDGALARLFAAPVKVGQGERVYLPAQTAAATGLSPQLDGTAAPLTESQVQGQERVDLRARGLLTDDDLVATIMGERTPVEAIGPEGKPIYMSPGEAVRTSAQPVQNKSSDPAPKVENWIGPDGTGGIAVFDRATNQYVDTSTKQPLPAGSRTYTGQLQGGAEATGFGKTTEAQDRNAYAATMAEAPTDRLLKAFDTGQLPTTQDYVVFNLMSKVPVAAAPALVGQMSESGQTFYQDLRTALPFQLMTQSGAAVTEQEYERKLLELIPVPGEAAAVTKAKRENFATYLKAVRGVSGAAYDKIHAGGDIDKPALPGAAPAGASATGGPVRVASPDEARKLPSGTAIILPDGSEGRVP